MQYNFDWNTKKAKLNLSKHKISFEQAVSIFRDPRALTIYDKDHSDNEDRWLTLGLTINGKLVIVSHTYKEIDENVINIRIISARNATKNEQKQYNEE